MKGYKHVTEEQKKLILETYQQTLSTQRCVEISHATKSQVWHLLQKEGIEPSNAREGACYRHIDDVRQWAKEGVSYSEIARRIGTNHHRVADFLAKHSIERTPFVQEGKNNPRWKGGRIVDKDGYTLVHQPDHPYADRHGYVREHRLVVEQEIGCYLLPTDVVHHIDGNKTNNAPENLQISGSNGHHLADTRTGKTPNISPEGMDRIRESTRRLNQRRWKTNRPELAKDADQ